MKWNLKGITVGTGTSMLAISITTNINNNMNMTNLLTKNLLTPTWRSLARQPLQASKLTPSWRLLARQPIHTSLKTNTKIKIISKATTTRITNTQCGGSMESVSFSWIWIRIKNGWIRNPDRIHIKWFRIQLKPLKTENNFDFFTLI